MMQMLVLIFLFAGIGGGFLYISLGLYRLLYRFSGKRKVLTEAELRLEEYRNETGMTKKEFAAYIKGVQTRPEIFDALKDRLYPKPTPEEEKQKDEEFYKVIRDKVFEILSQEEKAVAEAPAAASEGSLKPDATKAPADSKKLQSIAKTEDWLTQHPKAAEQIVINEEVYLNGNAGRKDTA
jgi:hypothetical protein